MKRKLIVAITVLLTAVLLLTPVFSVSAAESKGKKFTVTVTSAQVKAGEEVKVKINLSNNPGISSIKLRVGYDSVLTLKDVEFNEAFGTYVTAPEPYANPETLSLVSPTKDITYNGTFATLTFKTSKNITNDYDAKITLTYDQKNIFNKNLDNVPMEAVNGKVTVIGEKQSDYYVNFDANGGTVSVKSKKVTNHTTYGELPVPARNGYKFVGWYSSKNGGKKYMDDTVVDQTNTQTLYAHWIKDNIPSVTKVTINDIKIKYKKTAVITPEVKTDGNVQYQITYKSSDPSVASVDSKGNVSALRYGDAVITCLVTDSNDITVKDTCTVTVGYTWWQILIIVFLFGWIWYI